MPVRAYLQHLVRINHGELPSLPPAFSTTQSLSADELMAILLFGTPKSWQKEMDRQGFDPLENTIEIVVEFMERMEATNEFDGQAIKPQAKQNHSKKAHGSGKKSPPSAQGGKKKFCLLHGEGGHDTDESFTL